MGKDLHDINKLKQIMELTSETLLLISADGICLDVVNTTDLRFLQPDVLIGKNVLLLLPEHTYHKLIVNFQEVLTNGKTITQGFRLPLADKTYFGECKLIPFEGKVLCRYIDITNRENVKLRLTQTHEEMQEIQSVASIGKWILDTQTMMITYIGFYQSFDGTRTMKLSVDRYINFIIPEDRDKVRLWLKMVLAQPYNQNVSFRIRMMKNIHYMSVKCIFRKKEVQHRRNIIEGITYIRRSMERKRGARFLCRI